LALWLSDVLGGGIDYRIWIDSTDEAGEINHH
jgi:hypothetical protein